MSVCPVSSFHVDVVSEVWLHVSIVMSTAKFDVKVGMKVLL